MQMRQRRRWSFSDHVRATMFEIRKIHVDTALAIAGTAPELNRKNSRTPSIEKMKQVISSSRVLAAKNAHHFAIPGKRRGVPAPALKNCRDSRARLPIKVLTVNRRKRVMPWRMRWLMESTLKSAKPKSEPAFLTRLRNSRDALSAGTPGGSRRIMPVRAAKLKICPPGVVTFHTAAPWAASLNFGGRTPRT